MKRFFAAVGILICCVSMGGCWDYRGLNDINIVAGMAIDRDAATGGYYITVEIIDTLSSGDQNGLKAKYVESTGETLFDALRNAKKKLINKLYGGNMQVAIISREIAKTDGIMFIIEQLLRDGEPRETLSLVISEEKTAKEVLMTEGIDSNIISYEINQMIEEDSSVTGATVNTPMYKAYEEVKGEGNSLVLPVIKISTNNEKKVTEEDGIAVFNEGRLAGFISTRDSLFFLMTVNQLKGGVLSFTVDASDEEVSLGIQESDSKIKASYQDGQLFVNVDIDLKLNIVEVKSKVDISQAEQRAVFENMTAEYVTQKVLRFFQETQSEKKIDIFSIGSIIYKKDPALWETLKQDWDQVFENAHVQISTKVKVTSAGVMKNF